MKQITQRDKADEKVEEIKTVLKLSSLDYYLEESPYSLTIQLRKFFRKDFSPLLLSENPPEDLTYPDSSHQLHFILKPK